MDKTGVTGARLVTFWNTNIINIQRAARDQVHKFSALQLSLNSLYIIIDVFVIDKSLQVSDIIF